MIDAAPADAVMRIRNPRDFYSGLLFAAMGVAFAVGASGYDVGTAAQMGPGYFPRMLGVITAMLGAVVMLKSMAFEVEDGGRIGAWAWRPMTLVILANLLFGVMIGGLPSIGLMPLGLVLAVYALTFVASLGGEEFRFHEIAVLATLLAVASYVGCVALLRLQFPVWPWFLAG